MSQIKISTLAILSLWIAIPLGPLFAMASPQIFDGVNVHFSFSAGYPLAVYSWTVDGSNGKVTAWNVSVVGMVVNYCIYAFATFAWLVIMKLIASRPWRGQTR